MVKSPDSRKNWPERSLQQHVYRSPDHLIWLASQVFQKDLPLEMTHKGRVRHLRKVEQRTVRVGQVGEF